MARLVELRGNETQAIFSKKLGLSTSTYGRYEAGSREPSLDDLIQIGARTGVSADWLLGLDSEQSKSITASNSAVNTNGHTRINVGAAADTDRLLAIIESQQRTIERLAK